MVVVSQKSSSPPTHECYYHSLTTCTGELGGAEIALRIVDDQTGEVYIDQTAALEDNGFTGVWVPIDVTATVTITSDRGTGEAQISTGDDDLLPHQPAVD